VVCGESTMRKTRKLSLSQRRRIFRKLVDSQENGRPIERYRNTISEQHGITPGPVLLIEQEGIKHQWPPLQLLAPVSLAATTVAPKD
jgi:hypothetical protein